MAESITAGRRTSKVSKKFGRCVKTVRKTIKPRKGSNKESAAIAICTKSVLQTRGRTMKRYRKGRLTTQKKFRGGHTYGKQQTILAELYVSTLGASGDVDVSVTDVPNWQQQIADLKTKIASAAEEKKSTFGRVASFVQNRIGDIASKEDTVSFLDELAKTGKVPEVELEDLRGYVKRIEKSAA